MCVSIELCKVIHAIKWDGINRLTPSLHMMVKTRFLKQVDNYTIFREYVKCVLPLFIEVVGPAN